MCASLYNLFATNILTILVTVPVIILSIYFVFRWPRTITEGINDSRYTPKIIEATKTGAQIAGALLLIIGVYFTWQSLQVEKRRDYTQRFERAIKMLSNKGDLEIRIGGVYAFDHLAEESAIDRLSIIQILTSFVRNNAPCTAPCENKEGERVKDDIEAILYVLFNPRSNFKGLLKGHKLWKTNLQGAYLVKSSLQEVWFSGSSLYKAKLMEADLKDAIFRPYEQAGGVRMLPAILKGADLKGAKLIGTRFEGVDLSETKNLTPEQLKQACINSDTTLPDSDEFKNFKKERLDELKENRCKYIVYAR